MLAGKEESGLGNKDTFMCSEAGVCERCFSFSNEKLEGTWDLFLSTNTALFGADIVKE